MDHCDYVYIYPYIKKSMCSDKGLFEDYNPSITNNSICFAVLTTASSLHSSSRLDRLGGADGRL